jgi:phosphomannomutase
LKEDSRQESAESQSAPASPIEYRCPGQQHPIGRAAHLGRLAAFYPLCRQCPHRDDTGTLSPRQIEQLQEVRAGHRPCSLFHAEGAGGVYLNDLAPAAARDIAAAFGQLFSEARCAAPKPAVVLAGDGRAITAELSAAASEGLRRGGCNVIDIGAATAACLAFAVHHLSAAGGMLVGNASEKPHRVGLQFWAAGPRPLSAGGSLEPVVQLYQSGIDRPSRRFGDLHRAAAEEPYLAALSECYHALRPLRIVIASASGPLLAYLQRLAAAVACQVIPCRVASGELPEQIRADAAHFAACVEGDGETCRMLDERGQAVPAERLLLLLARHYINTADRQPATIALESSTPAAVGRRIEQFGGRATMGGNRRAEMAAAMREQGAVLGGGPSGRFWHLAAGVPLPDALMTITRLLLLLSRSDEPLSAVGWRCDGQARSVIASDAQTGNLDYVGDALCPVPLRVVDAP